MRTLHTFRNAFPLLTAALILVLGLASPAAAQSARRVSFFGGALFTDSSGFAGGVGLGLGLTRNVVFEPTFAVGRSGHSNLFTLDGSFAYEFHPDDEAFVPYLLAGVGMSQFGSSTHGSGIVGGGIRFPIGHNEWIQPEVRAGAHGLGRFTIAFTKTF